MSVDGQTGRESWTEFFGHAVRSRSFVTGAVIVIAVLAMGIMSLIWTPYDVTKLIIADRLQPPSAQHWLGTDHFGRDITSMIMVGAANSILVSLVAVMIGIGLGVFLGLFGSWFTAARHMRRIEPR